VPSVCRHLGNGRALGGSVSATSPSLRRRSAGGPTLFVLSTRAEWAPALPLRAGRVLPAGQADGQVRSSRERDPMLGLGHLLSPFVRCDCVSGTRASHSEVLEKLTAPHRRSEHASAGPNDVWVVPQKQLTMNSPECAPVCAPT
jgi:hypothetical protein